MPNTNLNPVAGTDGIVPILNQNARWQIWALHDIYVGGAGSNKYVPNINDYVIDFTTDEKFRVIAIDQTTLIPTLQAVTTVNSGVFSASDVMLGVGPGTPADLFRVYIDKSTTPYSMAVDANLYIPSVGAIKATIFRGSLTNGAPTPISEVYDQAGNLLGNSIPLELANIDGQNIATKSIPVCKTSADLPDNEIVTVVFYDINDNVLHKRQLFVENTAFIRGANRPIRYITGITLESPFMSQNDNTLIQYPINLPLNGLGLTGVVHYSNGETVRMPVDGTKFALYGLENFLSTIVGQQLKLVLRYSLSADEVVYSANVVNTDRFITANYSASTMKADGAYSVKLFGYPVWVDAVHGYSIEWFLCNLNRDVAYRVTPYVTYENSTAFNPLGYGIVQNLKVAINMTDVNPSFTPYKHVQSIAFTLLGAGNAHANNWRIAFTPGQNPEYGTNVFVLTPPRVDANQTASNVDISCGLTTLAAWLDLLYTNSEPLTDPVAEIAPPVPNYFAIVVNNQDIAFPIANWNAQLNIPTVLADFGTLFVKFLYRGPVNDQVLSVVGLPIRVQ